MQAVHTLCPLFPRYGGVGGLSTDWCIMDKYILQAQPHIKLHLILLIWSATITLQETFVLHLKFFSNDLTLISSHMVIDLFLLLHLNFGTLFLQASVLLIVYKLLNEILKHIYLNLPSAISQCDVSSLLTFIIIIIIIISLLLVLWYRLIVHEYKLQ
jgi:hypothetical protein